MTTTIAYTEIELTPNDHTGSTTPFVSPVFLDAFRKVEGLCREGKSLASDVRKLAFADWSETDFEPGVRFLQKWLALQFVNEAFPEALKQLDARLSQLSSPLDRRNNSIQDACDENCMAAWLKDGRRINVIKGRALLQTAPLLQKTFADALNDTKDEACQVRETLTRLAEHAATGSTSYVLDSELLENA